MACVAMQTLSGAEACVSGTYVRDDGCTVFPVTELEQVDDSNDALAQFLAAAAVVIAGGGTVEEVECSGMGEERSCVPEGGALCGAYSASAGDDVVDAEVVARSVVELGRYGSECEGCEEFVGAAPFGVASGIAESVCAGHGTGGMREGNSETDGTCYLAMFPVAVHEKMRGVLRSRPTVRELFAYEHAMLPSAELSRLGCTISADLKYLHVGRGVVSRVTADDFAVVVRAVEGTAAGAALGDMRVGTGMGVAAVFAKMETVFGKQFSVGYPDYITAVRSDAVVAHVMGGASDARLACEGHGAGARLELVSAPAGDSLADVVAGRSQRFDEWLRAFQAYVGPPNAVPEGKVRCAVCGFLVVEKGHANRCEPALEVVPDGVLAAALEGDKLHQWDVVRALRASGCAYSRLTEAAAEFTAGTAQASWIAERSAVPGAYTARATRGLASRASTQFEALYGGRRRQAYLAWLWNCLGLQTHLARGAMVECPDPIGYGEACKFYGVPEAAAQQYDVFFEAWARRGSVVELCRVLLSTGLPPTLAVSPPGQAGAGRRLTDVEESAARLSLSSSTGGSTASAESEQQCATWTMPERDEDKPLLKCGKPGCGASFMHKKTLAGHFRVTGHGPVVFEVEQVRVGGLGAEKDVAPWKCDETGARLVCMRCPGEEGSGGKVFSWVPGLRKHYDKKHSGCEVRQWVEQDGRGH